MGRFGKSVALAMAACVLMAARAQPIYSVQQHPIPASVSRKLDDQHLALLFADAARQNGWRVLPAAPGHLSATLSIHTTHSLTIDITYDRSAFSIIVVSSERLKQEAGVIHPAANKAIHQLESSIEAAMSRIAF
jgi:hypothetical protein